MQQITRAASGNQNESGSEIYRELMFRCRLGDVPRKTPLEAYRPGNRRVTSNGEVFGSAVRPVDFASKLIAATGTERGGGLPAGAGTKCISSGRHRPRDDGAS